MVATCTSCGRLWEYSSVENACEPDRLCKPCFDFKKSMEDPEFAEMVGIMLEDET